MNCKNCYNQLTIDSQFCNQCGGKVIRNRLTFRNLFEHITETFFNYDNKLLRTFIDLFKKPEAVIRGYIEGIRRRYVNPISYLALAITIGGIYFIVLNKFFPNALAAGMSISDDKNQQEMVSVMVKYIGEYYSIMMILFIPPYALLSRLVFINRKEFNFTEHIVMAMYIMAQFSLVSSFLNITLLVLQLPPDLLGSTSIFLQIAFFAYCYKRMYKLSFGGLVLRTLFFLGILIAIMIGCILLGVIVAIFFNDSPFVQQIMESQKSAIEAQKTVLDSIPK